MSPANKFTVVFLDGEDKLLGTVTKAPAKSCWDLEFINVTEPAFRSGMRPKTRIRASYSDMHETKTTTWGENDTELRVPESEVAVIIVGKRTKNVTYWKQRSKAIASMKDRWKKKGYPGDSPPGLLEFENEWATHLTQTGEVLSERGSGDQPQSTQKRQHQDEVTSPTPAKRPKTNETQTPEPPSEEMISCPSDLDGEVVGGEDAASMEQSSDTPEDKETVQQRVFHTAKRMVLDMTTKDEFERLTQLCSCERVLKKLQISSTYTTVTSAFEDVISSLVEVVVTNFNPSEAADIVVGILMLLSERGHEDLDMKALDTAQCKCGQLLGAKQKESGKQNPEKSKEVASTCLDALDLCNKQRETVQKWFERWETTQKADELVILELARLLPERIKGCEEDKKKFGYLQVKLQENTKALISEFKKLQSHRCCELDEKRAKALPENTDELDYQTLQEALGNDEGLNTAWNRYRECYDKNIVANARLEAELATITKHLKLWESIQRLLQEAQTLRVGRSESAVNEIQAEIHKRTKSLGSSLKKIGPTLIQAATEYLQHNLEKQAKIASKTEALGSPDDQNPLIVGMRTGKLTALKSESETLVERLQQCWSSQLKLLDPTIRRLVSFSTLDKTLREKYGELWIDLAKPLLEAIQDSSALDEVHETKEYEAELESNEVVQGRNDDDDLTSDDSVQHGNSLGNDVNNDSEEAPRTGFWSWFG